MRIAALTHNYPRFPGDFSGVFVAALCQELARQGEQVQVIAPWDAAFQRAENQGNPASNPQMALYRYAPSAGLHILGYGRSMEADLRLRRSSLLLAPFLLISGYAKTMAVARRFKPELLHAHWLVPNGLIAAWAARRLHIPLVISIPGSDARVAGANPLFAGLARAALRQADWMTANSAELRQVAITSLGAPPERFDLMLYGVDPQALYPDPRARIITRQRLGLAETTFTILAVGRMVPKKGFDILLHALTCLPASLDWRTILIGEGDCLAEWQALAHSLGIAEHLYWAGTIPTGEMPGYYNAADVLAMPSVNRPQDGLNVCVLDALSCGCPVVASEVGGNPLAVRHRQNGLLVPEANADALAQALTDLTSDPDLRRRLGAQGRQDVLNELGWPSIAARYRARYQEIISSFGVSQ